MVYPSGLLLPGYQFCDRFSYAVRSQAAAEREYSELVGKPQAFSRSGEKYYLLQAVTLLNKAVRLAAERDVERAERDDA